MLFKDYLNQERKESNVRNCYFEIIEKEFGVNAAALIALGGDCVASFEEAMDLLKTKPWGTHLGEISDKNCSRFLCDLPQKFVTRYNYEFIYDLWCKYHEMMYSYSKGYWFRANTVFDQLIIYVCVKSGLSKFNELCQKKGVIFDDVSGDLGWLDKYFGHISNNILYGLYHDEFNYKLIRKEDPYNNFYFNNWNKTFDNYIGM